MWMTAQLRSCLGSGPVGIPTSTKFDNYSRRVDDGYCIEVEENNIPEVWLGEQFLQINRLVP